MDDGSSNTWMLLIIGLIALVRLLNNLVKAGYFGMGSIAVIALAQKSRDSKNPLSNYLDNPMKLSISAQFLDKLGLFALVWCGWEWVHAPLVGHWFMFFGYLLVFDFMVPHVLAVFHSEAMVVRLFPLVRPFYTIFYPITLPFAMMAASQKQKEIEEDEEEDPEDIQAFIRAGTDEGIIEEKEHSMLKNLLVFNDTIVREIMTPRTDMVCLDVDMPKDEILEVFKRTKHSRLPVYRGDFDHVEGVLRFKDFVGLVNTQEHLEDHLLQPLFVPEGMNISDLMTDMLKNRLQMAVVIDEYGGTSGLVTLEDLVEEIVGDIHEEHEHAETSDIVPQDNGDVLVDGRVLLDDFAEFFKIDITAEDVDTIAGFIFNREGRILEQGSETEIGDKRIRIEHSDERRIYQIRVLAASKMKAPAST